MTIRPGMCSIACRGLDPSAVIDAAVAAGLEGIEWGADVHVPPGNLGTARDVAQWCADAGLAVPSYGSYLRAGERDELDPVLDAAEALGVDTVRVWAGARASADADDAYRALVTDELAAWAHAASERGLSVALEYHAGTLTDTAASTLELMSSATTAGAPESRLVTYWQPRDGDAGGHDLDELRQISAHLAHVHVFWWRSWIERFPLGDGATFWRDALALADTAPVHQPPRWALIEFVLGDDRDQLARDASALRSWL